MQYQLALALSESAYEAEQLQEFEQAALLAGIPSDCIKDLNDEERKITLQKFGFTSNKTPTDAPPTRNKKSNFMFYNFLIFFFFNFRLFFRK